MIAAAIEKLLKMTGEARALDVVTNRDDPHRYWLHNKAAVTYEEKAISPQVSRTALSIGSFCDVLGNLPPSDFRDYGFDVYVDRSRIVCVLSELRREKLTMFLEPSAAMRWLSAQVDSSSRCDLPQRELMRLLRTTLPKDQALYDAVSSLKVSKQESGESSIKHGKESIGRSLLKELVGWQGPENVTFTIPVFDQPPGLDPVTVECLVDLDLGCDGDPPSFSLIPTTGQIEGAWRDAMNQIIESLRLVAERTTANSEDAALHLNLYAGSISVR